MTCPTAARCPSGNTDLYINEWNQRQGISDSWGWFQYTAYSVCKFRVHSDKPKSNLLLSVDSISPSQQLVVMVMQKNKQQFPDYTFTVSSTSNQTKFNVSAEYFEYWVTVMPDTF